MSLPIHVPTLNPPAGVIVDVLKKKGKRKAYQPMGGPEDDMLFRSFALAPNPERRLKEAVDDFYAGFDQMQSEFEDFNIPTDRLNYHYEGWQKGYLDEAELEAIRSNLTTNSENGEEQQATAGGLGFSSTGANDSFGINAFLTSAHHQNQSQFEYQNQSQFGYQSQSQFGYQSQPFVRPPPANFPVRPVLRQSSSPPPPPPPPPSFHRSHLNLQQ